MKPLVVVNPRAGAGRAGRAFADLRPIIEQALGSIDVVFTERRGHAIDLAREGAVGGRDLVVAVGGDGTLHEVANGVLDGGGRAALGFIGQGTGGDFRRSLGLEHRLDRYLAAIASGHERQVDAARATFRDDDGRETTRWFVNVLSAGIGGLVDRYVAETSRSLGPTLAYAMATVRAISESTPATIACTIHRGTAREERTLEAYVVAVCNGTSFGSGMRIAPMAAIDDGQLEVIALNAPSKLAFAALGRKLYTAGHLADPGVTRFSCDAIDLTVAGERPDRRVLLDVDGEPLGALPVRITLARGALRVRAPA